MTSIRIALLGLALCSAAAQADDSVAAFEASPSADRMTPISEGLYGRREAAAEAYVANTPAGHRALLRRLLELRAANSASLQKRPMRRRTRLIA